MSMELKAVDPHLTDAELFTLAAPPVGEPEALPHHLSECFRCSRALQEWKLAVREIADEDTEAVDRRAPAEWEALENETIAAMRRAGRRRGPATQWAVSIAAALLLGVLLLPVLRKGGLGARGDFSRTAAAAMAAQDQNDDALLRDVARLSRGEDSGSWNSLAPEPGGDRADRVAGEEHL